MSRPWDNDVTAQGDYFAKAIHCPTWDEWIGYLLRCRTVRKDFRRTAERASLSYLNYAEAQSEKIGKSYVKDNHLHCYEFYRDTLIALRAKNIEREKANFLIEALAQYILPENFGRCSS